MPDHLDGLNPQQFDAVDHTEGPLLVLAGAGTGKTRVVTARIAEIIRRGADPASVCAVTFTNKAAREMRERVGKLVSGRAKDGLVVSTFHSLGARILRDEGLAIGIPRNFTIADSSDQEGLVADALRDFGMGRDQIQPKDAHHRISMWKNAGLTPEQALTRTNSVEEEKLAHVFARYEEALAHRGLVDFDDLIQKALLLLEKHRHVAERLQDRWRYHLVDEYQDTNDAQYRLMQLLCGERANVCVVGDDDQSIYGWRGADPSRILRFTRDFHRAKVVTLVQNYRSTMNILRAANRVIVNNGSRREKELWSALGDGDPVKLYVATDEKDEMDWVGRNVERLVRGGTPLKEISILFRTNRQCRPLEQTLRARQVPYRVLGTFSFFDRREVRDLLAFLRVTHNPRDDAAFLRIVNTPPRGIGKGTVDVLKKRSGELRDGLKRACDVTVESGVASGIQAKAQDGIKVLLDTFTLLENESKTVGVAQAIENLVERIQYRDFLKMDVKEPLDLTMRLATVDELIQTAREWEQRAPAKGIGPFIESLSLREEDRRDDEKEKPAVSLLTVHAAKGLEFNHVYVVGVEEGILPHKGSVTDEEDGEAAATDHGLEEERRLFYVAVTRARRKLAISYTTKRMKYGKEELRVPSRFLDEMGRQGVEVEDGASQEPVTAEEGKQAMNDLLARLRSAKPRTP